MLIVLHYEADDLDRLVLCLIVASQLIEIPKEGIQNLNRLVVTARTALPDARPIFFEAHFEAIDTESMDILGRGELTIKQRLNSVIDRILDCVEFSELLAPFSAFDASVAAIGAYNRDHRSCGREW